MIDETSKLEKARQIMSFLPRENCGKCGFQNCGRFALAVAEGEASPFGCHRNPSVGYEISKVLGVEAPGEAKVSAVYSEFHHMGRRHGGSHGFGHHALSFGHDNAKRGHRHPGKHHVKQHSC